jgi:hypothetical protein
MSNGNAANFYIPNGKNGQDGQDGQDGDIPEWHQPPIVTYAYYRSEEEITSWEIDYDNEDGWPSINGTRWTQA